ncbi:MAG: ATP-binding protein, partial [Chlamydiales bacterium]
EASFSLRAKVSEMIEAIISLIDGLLSPLFRSPSDQGERDTKFQKITMTLVSLFSMFTTTLIPLLGLTVAGPIIAAVFLLIGVLSFTYPKIAPIPSKLPCRARNWTKECRLKRVDNFSYARSRENVLNEIANTLIKNKEGQLKKHPLLKGESRVGKTQTAKAFVEAIERGNYEELKGMKVFYLNAADLCKGSNVHEGKGSLENLSDAIADFKENIILVIDEIQTPFLSENYASVGQKLKSMLDYDGDFPYVIGIATSGDLFQNFGNDVAFVNRFHPITIESTGSEETQVILAQGIFAEGKSVLFEEGALKKIYQKTAEKPQPYFSNLVLRKCIELTSKTQKSPLLKRVQELKNRKQFLASQGVLSLEIEDDVHSEIEELDNQIRKLEQQLTQETKVFEHLFQKKEEISNAKTVIYRTVSKVADIQASVLSSSDKVQLNTFMLMSRFLVPALDTYVRSQAKKLNVKVVIDESIIEEALNSV